MAAALRWIKSSYTGADSNNCVECAADGRVVWIRDSKDQAKVLVVSMAGWHAFLAVVGI